MVCLTLLSVVSAQVTAPIPILDRDPGIRLDAESSGAAVKLEAFIELICSDSNYSYPILKQLQEHYGPDNLEVVIHQLALPYHRQAMLTVQGLYYVMDVDPENAFPYMDAIYADFTSISGSNTRELSENQVVELMGQIQEPGTGIPAATFANNVYGYGSPAIRAWKYATRRGIAGTPWFVLNNVDLAINPSIRISYEEWRDFLDPLMPESQGKKQEITAPETQKKNTPIKKNDEMTDDMKRQLKERAVKMASLKLAQLLKIKKHPRV